MSVIFLAQFLLWTEDWTLRERSKEEKGIVFIEHKDAWRGLIF